MVCCWLFVGGCSAAVGSSSTTCSSAVAVESTTIGLFGFFDCVGLTGLGLCERLAFVVVVFIL